MFRIVVVGASLGGITAIEKLVADLISSFGLPMAIVQHRSKGYEGLETFLSQRSPIPVTGVQDKDEIVAGRVYLAPPDYHLLVESDHFALSTDEPVLHSRPSIDVLFESAAEAFGPGVIGVILTGSSADGANGARAIKKRGGFVICQDPDSAQSPIMPAAAIAAANPDRVLPLPEIGPLLVRMANEP